MFECQAIGTIETPFESPADAPRQGTHERAKGTIRIESDFLPALQGIEAGSEILVVWFAHEADRSLLQLDREPERGVFTSRSESRPNPICLTQCTVETVEDGTVEVLGVDMIDGTPILDLKPPLS